MLMLLTPEDLKQYVDDIDESREEIRDDLLARFLIAAYPDEINERN
jgi:hypothetical protein